mmetsp:Transcript_24132/g.61418  ORF Transcript_24132/g.61418 Transcript_24132/m.61418 type:complete len:254 (+) Transcript_24132:212-973(+)
MPPAAPYALQAYCQVCACAYRPTNAPLPAAFTLLPVGIMPQTFPHDPLTHPAPSLVSAQQLGSHGVRVTVQAGPPLAARAAARRRPQVHRALEAAAHERRARVGPRDHQHARLRHTHLPAHAPRVRPRLGRRHQHQVRAVVARAAGPSWVVQRVLGPQHHAERERAVAVERAALHLVRVGQHAAGHRGQEHLVRAARGHQRVAHALLVRAQVGGVLVVGDAAHAAACRRAGAGAAQEGGHGRLVQPLPRKGAA